MLWGCFEHLNDVERFIVCKVNEQYQNYQAQIDELVRISMKGYNRYPYIYGSLLPSKRYKFDEKYLRIQFRQIGRAQSITRYLQSKNLDKLSDWQRYFVIKLNLLQEQSILNLYIDKLIKLNEDPQTKQAYQNIYLCIQDKRKFFKRVRDMHKDINDFIPEQPKQRGSDIKMAPPKKKSCLWQLKDFIKDYFSNSKK